MRFRMCQRVREGWYVPFRKENEVRSSTCQREKEWGCIFHVSTKGWHWICASQKHRKNESLRNKMGFYIRIAKGRMRFDVFGFTDKEKHEIRLSTFQRAQGITLWSSSTDNYIVIPLRRGPQARTVSDWKNPKTFKNKKTKIVIDLHRRLHCDPPLQRIAA